MLTKITILTSLLFAILYPLCFWISHKEPLQNNFHRFHTGLPTVVAGIMLITGWNIFSPDIQKLLTIWFILLLIFTAYYWRKSYPNPGMISLPVLAGLYAFIYVHAFLCLPQTPLAILINILGGLIFCISVFSMNLGHWYLNVHGLPMKHLKKAVYVFAALLSLRLIWDIFYVMRVRVLYREEWMPMSQFIFTMDGIFIFIAILFGTFFPLAALHFVKETIKLKNTQSATGILYTILCGLLIGDMTYKYYLIKYGIYL